MIRIKKFIVDWINIWVSSLIYNLYLFVDALIYAKLGEITLAAVLSCSFLLMCFNSFFVGLSIYLRNKFSQSNSNERLEIQAIFTSVCVTVVIYSLASLLLFKFFGEVFFNLMLSESDTIRAVAIDYFSVKMFSMFFYGIGFVSSAYLLGTNRSNIEISRVLISNLSQLAFTFIATTQTADVKWIAFFSLFPMIVVEVFYLAICRSIKPATFRFSHCLISISNSAPLWISQLNSVAIYLLLIAIYSRAGDEVLTIMLIGFRLSRFFYSGAKAIGIAVSIQVSSLYRKSKFSEVISAIKVANFVGLTSHLFLSLLCIAYDDVFTTLFISDDSYHRVFYNVFYLILLLSLVEVVISIFNNALIAIGCAKVATMGLLVGSWCLLLPLSYLFQIHNTVEAFHYWLAIAFSDFVVCLAMIFIFKQFTKSLSQ